MAKDKLTNLDKKILEEMYLSKHFESWKPVVINGIQTDYQISNHGRLMGKFGKIMTPAPNSSGYPQTVIRVGKPPDVKKYTRGIHRLVAENWIPNTDNRKDQVNHRDGNKNNNHINNLEWCTQQENIDHAVKTGLRDGFRGEGSPKNVYSEKQVRGACELLAKNITDEQVARTMKMNKGSVRSIRRRKMWKHVSKDYVFPPKN